MTAPRSKPDLAAPLLLSLPDVEQHLGIGRTRVYELIGSGALASVKLGRRRLVRREDLEAFVAGLPEGAL